MAKYIISTEKSKQYLEFKLTDSELFEEIGDSENIGVEAEAKSIVYLEKYHVKNMLSLLLSNRITKDDAIEWAETMILTFLYDWDEKKYR